MKKIGDTLVVDAPIGQDEKSDDPVRRAVNSDGQHAATRFEVLDVGVLPAEWLNFTLPETNIAPETRPSQKETSIPTIHFQVLC